MKKNNNLHLSFKVKWGWISISFLMICLIFVHILFKLGNASHPQLKTSYSFKNVKRSLASIREIPIIENIIKKNDRQVVWIDEFMSPNSSSIIKEAKDQVRTWEQIDSFASTWNLKEFYSSPEVKEKQIFIRNRLLSFFDKKLHQQMKQAKNGSPLHTIHQVEKSLSPKAQVEVFTDMKLKMKSQLLQGNVYLDFENPYLFFQTKLNFNNGAQSQIKKELPFLGAQASLDYLWNDQVWLARLEGNISPFVKAGFSAEQEKTLLSGAYKETKVEVLFHYPF